jgi:hypothetical protein
VERFRSIAELVDLRRLPLTDGNNHMSTVSHLNEHPRMYWSPILHMIYHKQVTEEKMIGVFKELIGLGFHLEQSLKLSNHANYEDEFYMPRVPVVLGAALVLAIERGCD